MVLPVMLVVLMFFPTKPLCHP